MHLGRPAGGGLRLKLDLCVFHIRRIELDVRRCNEGCKVAREVFLPTSPLKFEREPHDLHEVGVDHARDCTCNAFLCSLRSASKKDVGDDAGERTSDGLRFWIGERADVCAREYAPATRHCLRLCDVHGIHQC